ncbi:MAG: hypothetical protein AB1489_21415 [Acidobacteriota bacterium]
MEKELVDKIIHYLSSCPGGEFADILRAILENRPENKNNAYSETKLILAEAFREISEDSEDSEIPTKWTDWQISLIGYQNPRYYTEEWLVSGEPFLQSGYCDNCKMYVSSHVKGALCPLCENEISCT